MSDLDLATTDEQERCAVICDEVAKRFWKQVSVISPSSLDSIIARARAETAEGCAGIIRARAG